MGNERKTEDIVRDHFKQYLSDIHLEEQISDNPKLKKLLSTASKSGGGAGYPEFIIRLKTNPDLIIVVECKASTTRHKSATGDKFRDFAVDGALLYASYLSKDFDVIAIAVSGESKSNINISHFLQLKGENSSSTKFGSKLLAPSDYLEGYLKSPEKFRQDYDSLLNFSRDLNTKLHKNKILESERSLLISCVLIALENKAFQQTYKTYLKAEDLARFLVDTVEMEFKNSGIQENKLKIVGSRFAFIKNDTSLSKRDNVLSEVISDIDENISQFIKNHEYFDVLGQLYIEFLRYANSDKGLGIVLTPPHITEFMSELAEVNKDSIVYDSCTGTGGFLVSAMDQMIKDAKGDQKKIRHIKQNQLIGIEYQAHIFALAVSNMFIHQDGKTNILNGSCFDEEIINQVKKHRPNVGLLNPPYKADKKNDVEELEFILNNLECIEQGGKTVAIVPMSVALAQKGKVLQLKKRLLDLHTLEAVLSMPDELFFNSKVGVISCIMVFTAKRPHQKNKKVFFGYFKNDGFVKQKNKGRNDAVGKWEAMKERWISAYINKEDIAGLSINAIVSAEDEWAAEAYMETNYLQLNEDFFTKTLLQYSSYLFLNKIVPSVSDEKTVEKKMPLNIADWAYIPLTKLFAVSASRDELINDLTLGGNTPYITSSDSNNGVTSYVEEGSTNKANTITANRGGSVGYFYYQAIPYKATPVDVRILTPKFDMNVYTGLFLTTVLQLEKYRYNYSRKMGSDRLVSFNIKLPVKNGEPDFRYMEDYIKSCKYSKSIERK